MTKTDDECQCWIFDNEHIDGDVKVRDHCHVTEKYRDSAHRDCNIKVILNHKIPTTKWITNKYEL